MTVQNITITINNQKQSIENYSLIGGRNGIGTKGQPLHIEAKENVNYLLTNTDTQFAPENIATKRVGNNLYIAFEGADINSPDLIIDNYFAINGDSNSSADQANLIIGQHENGKYYPYVPESASKEDAVSQLAENHQAGQALGGDEIPPVWAFNPWWLAALIPLAAGGIAIHNSGGGSNKPQKPTTQVDKVGDTPPEAGDDHATTKENTPVEIALLANDSDKDGDLLISSVEVKSEPTQGSVTIDPATGNAIYTPNPGAHGTDTFTYVVYDQKGNVSNEATVTIDISTTPVAEADQATTQENTPVVIDLVANDRDKESGFDYYDNPTTSGLNPASVEVTREPTQGSVTIDKTTGEATYTPNTGAHGTDTFTYVVYDKEGNPSAPATVTVAISANPIAVDDSAKTTENTPVVIDLIDNDNDKDGDLNPASVEVIGKPTQGSVTIDKTTGEATYTPNKDAHGTDTFTYIVYDKEGNPSAPATVTVEISANPVDPVDPGKPVDPVDPVKPVDPIDPVDPVDPGKPVDPVDPIDPVDPVDPIDPVDPGKPVDPIDPVDPGKPVDPIDPVDPGKPVDPVDPGKPVDPVDPVKPVDPIDPVDPVDPGKPVDPVDPIDPVDPVDPIDPVDPGKPVDPIDPVDPGKPVDPVDPGKPVDPVDPVKPVDPIDPVDPVDPGKPVDPVDPIDPVDPVDPVDPGKPVDPIDPVDPGKPVDPIDPIDPGKPVDPVDPIDPVVLHNKIRTLF